MGSAGQMGIKTRKNASQLAMEASGRRALEAQQVYERTAPEIGIEVEVEVGEIQEEQRSESRMFYRICNVDGTL